MAASAYYCTWILGERNGFIPLLQEIEAAKPPKLPGTHVPVKLVYTGILNKVDHQLAVLATVFWPIVDGSSPSLTLQAFHFAGQFYAFWTVMELELRRVGHRWNILACGMIWGLLSQMFGFANIVPLYWCLHLFMSNVAVRSNGKGGTDLAPSLYIHPAAVAALPMSMFLGYALPNLLLCLPVPTWVSYETRQIFMSLWQMFPIGVGLIHLVLTMLPFNTTRFPRLHQPSADRDAFQLRQLRRTYRSAFIYASITHIAAWTISLSALMIPSIFEPPMASSLHPARVFLPPPPYSTTQVANIGEGLHNFLLYDEYIGSLATLLWTVVVYHNARGGWRSWAEPLALLGKIVGVSILAGPASATLLLLWERDELVLNGSTASNRRKKIL
ncbi:MAG: hypothetical protein M1823_004328 [Watsoniomyces obsoletus]|nr:MAG: hypothetical protein M1823_004328 [Watsoniomyces obsoletus]